MLELSDSLKYEDIFQSEKLIFFFKVTPTLEEKWKHFKPNQYAVLV